MSEWVRGRVYRIYGVYKVYGMGSKVEWDKELVRVRDRSMDGNWFI